MDGRRLVDRPDDLDRLDPVVVEVACPSCGVVRSTDVVHLARSIPSTFAAALDRSIDPERLGRLVDRLPGLSLEYFDGVAHLRGSTGLTVYLAPVTCVACGSGSDIVVSWGEFQPGRWQLTLEGVVCHEAS